MVEVKKAVVPRKPLQLASQRTLYVGYFLLAYLAAVMTALASIGIVAAINGQLVLASLATFTFCFFFWAVGSLYVTVPLSSYLSSKYRGTRDYAAIDAAHSRALRVLQKLPLHRRVDIATTLSNLGLVRLCQGYFESAESLFEQAAAYIDKHKHLNKTISAIIIHNNLAVACYRLNKLIEAELHATKALEIAEQPKLAKQYKLLTAPPMAVIASTRLRLGEYESALEYYRKAVAIYETAPLPFGLLSITVDQAKVLCYLGLALTYMKLDRQPEANEWCDKSLEFVRTDETAINTLSLEWLNRLANAYMDVKNFERAEQLLQLAYRIGREQPFHPDAQQTLKFYEKLFLLTGRENEIADMRSWLMDHPQMLVG